MKSVEGKEYPVRKVEYVDDYSINLEKIADSSGHISVASIHDELFYKKTSRWKYEDEYRMVRPLTDSPDYAIPETKFAYIDLNVYLFHPEVECVSSIIMGASMSVENKKIISQYCEQHKVPFSQAFIIRDYNDRWKKPSTVIILPVSSFMDKQNILRSSPQLFCSDTINYGHQNMKK